MGQADKNNARNKKKLDLHVSISNNNPLEIEALFDNLKTGPTITSVRLIFDKSISAADIQVIVIDIFTGLESHPAITTINLAHNNIGDIGAEALAEALKSNTTRTMIKLTINNISIAGIEKIEKLLIRNQDIARFTVLAEHMEKIAEYSSLQKTSG